MNRVAGNRKEGKHNEVQRLDARCPVKEKQRQKLCLSVMAFSLSDRGEQAVRFRADAAQETQENQRFPMNRNVFIRRD